MHGYLRHLANFAYVIEAGSISGAASRLEVSASSISDSVRILEAHVGELLVTRGRGGVSPTSRGTALYSEAAQIVAALGRALCPEHHQQITGVISLSVPQEIAENGLSKVIKRLAATYPALRLTVMVEDSVKDPTRHARDLFFRVGLGGPTPGLFPLWSQKVDILTVVHPDLLNGITEDEIYTLPFLCEINTGSGYVVKLNAPDQLVCFENTVQVSSAQTRLSMARQGVGVVTCLGFSVEEDIAQGQLVSIFKGRKARQGIMTLLSPNEKANPRELAVAQALDDTFGGLQGEEAD